MIYYQQLPVLRVRNLIFEFYNFGPGVSAVRGASSP
jgi:hypothetical protein